MTDRLDYELRAIEADNYAETAHRVSIAHSWRDIARGYRMLADFIAAAQTSWQRDGDERQHPPDARDTPASPDAFSRDGAPNRTASPVFRQAGSNRLDKS